MKKNITELTLEGDKILDKDVLDDKIGILDIRAKIEKNINCDIEMQVVDKKNAEKTGGTPMDSPGEGNGCRTDCRNDCDKLPRQFLSLFSE